jgi:hypothetical protein
MISPATAEQILVLFAVFCGSNEYIATCLQVRWVFSTKHAPADGLTKLARFNAFQVASALVGFLIDQY